MKLYTYYDDNGTACIAADTGQGIVPTAVRAADFYARGTDALDEIKSAAQIGTSAVDVTSLKLAPAVPSPEKIICVGLNYSKHAAESNMDEPAYPVLFSKFNNALAADGEPVPMSRDWEQVDYEAELVVVMGRTAKNVSEADALDYVLGYCCGDDLSERALQFRSGQWLLGKSLDKFLPIGPYVATKDEIPDPQNLRIRGWYNGELRQDSNTADMIFSVAEIIAYASQFMTLRPGDIISTGTPEGVILGMADKKFMQPGDEYVVEIEGLGRLTNKLVEATS